VRWEGALGAFDCSDTMTSPPWREAASCAAWRFFHAVKMAPANWARTTSTMIATLKRSLFTGYAFCEPASGWERELRMSVSAMMFFIW